MVSDFCFTRLSLKFFVPCKDKQIRNARGVSNQKVYGISKRDRPALTVVVTLPSMATAVANMVAFGCKSLERAVFGCGNAQTKRAGDLFIMQDVLFECAGRISGCARRWVFLALPTPIHQDTGECGYLGACCFAVIAPFLSIRCLLRGVSEWLLTVCTTYS